MATALPIPLLAPVITATGFPFMRSEFFRLSSARKINKLIDSSNCQHNYIKDIISQDVPALS